MNRRSFFGFACGGAVAGPAALVGQGPSPHQPSREEIQQIAIRFDVAAHGKLHAFVDRKVRESIAASRGPYESRRG